MKREHDCPDYCHPCPYLRGAIMPICMGTAVSCDDEMSLLHCTCIPGFPALAKMQTAERLAIAMSQLRDTRRRRLVQRLTVKRLAALVNALKFTTGVHVRARELATQIEHEISILRGELSGLMDGPSPRQPDEPERSNDAVRGRRNNPA